MDSTVILLVIVGLFSILCAVMNFDWFFNSRKSQFFVNLFGRNGARIFYVLLGLFIVAMGIMSHFAEAGA